MKTAGAFYWHGEGGEVLAETDLSGNNPKEYIYFNGQRIMRRDPSGAVFYYFGDHLGTSRVITASGGSVCYEADFHPFGGERVLTNTCAQNYKFTGHERDPESGFDHTLFRQYTSTLGRWTAPDPAEASPDEPQSLNRYSYVVNNPTNLTDPTGLWPENPPGGGCESGFCGGCGISGTCGGPDPCAGLVGADRVWCHIANFYQPEPDPFEGYFSFEFEVAYLTYRLKSQSLNYCNYEACKQVTHELVLSHCNTYTLLRWKMPSWQCKEGVSLFVTAYRVTITGYVSHIFGWCTQVEFAAEKWHDKDPCPRAGLSQCN